MAGRTTGSLAAIVWFLSTAPAMSQERNCCDAFDNDGDGWIDFRDPDCASNPHCLTPFRRGDVDLDGKTNITDVVILLGLAFRGLPPGTVCEDARDVNDDGALDLTDAIVLIDWLFRSGSAPPEPFLECGQDQTPDTFSACRGEASPDC